MEEKLRYSDEELQEFKQFVVEKLEKAKVEYDEIMDILMNRGGNDVVDTSPTYKILEEGSAVQSKEELTSMAARQLKFIQGLKGALERIENKSYGVCRITGKLIPKERLRAVPHATLTIEGKQIEKQRQEAMK
ncbi:MAG: TraR/DksA C4-type zinc finger protein [Alloprevotella sp.]|nr:TraR/DksA C4-type zinc finger protein [Alloprevotella sp.]